MTALEIDASGERCCSACGYRSASHWFFRREPGGLLGRNADYCLGCGPYAPTKRESASLFIPPVMIFGSVLLHVIGGHGGLSGLGNVFLFLGAYGFAHFLTVTVHEFGHATAAGLLGMRVLKITIGTGPLLASRKAGNTSVDVRRYLTAAGTTHCYDRSSSPSKWRQGLVLLGGAGANLAFFAIGILPFALLPADYHFSDPMLVIIAYAALASQLLSAVLNLVPRGASVGQVKAVSDGKRLIRLVRSRDYHRHALGVRLFWEGMPLLESGRNEEAWRYYSDAWRSLPGHVLLLVALIHSAGRVGGPRAALRCYFDHGQALGSTEGDDRAPAAAILAATAWNAVLADDRDLLPMADQLSRDAIAILPGLGDFQAIRGAVLVASQEREQGRELLIEGMRKVEERGRKAEFSRFLAAAYREQGAAALAGEWESLAAHLTRQRRGDRPTS